MLEETIKVGKKNVIVIPSKIRKKIGIKVGDLLAIKVEGNKIILEKLSSQPFAILADIIGEPYGEEVDEAEAEKWLKDRVR